MINFRGKRVYLIFVDDELMFCQYIRMQKDEDTAIPMAIFPQITSDAVRDILRGTRYVPFANLLQCRIPMNATIYFTNIWDITPFGGMDAVATDIGDRNIVDYIIETPKSKGIGKTDDELRNLLRNMNEVDREMLKRYVTNATTAVWYEIVFDIYVLAKIIHMSSNELVYVIGDDMCLKRFRRFFEVSEVRFRDADA